MANPQKENGHVDIANDVFEKFNSTVQEIHDSKDEIAWGNQIRSYVLHPYQMVKDHRINLDVGNVNAVLDGALDPFIEGVLLSGKA